MPFEIRSFSSAALALATPIARATMPAANALFIGDFLRGRADYTPIQCALQPPKLSCAHADERSSTRHRESSVSRGLCRRRTPRQKFVRAAPRRGARDGETRLHARQAQSARTTTRT